MKLPCISLINVTNTDASRWMKSRATVKKKYSAQLLEMLALIDRLVGNARGAGNHETRRKPRSREWRNWIKKKMSEATSRELAFYVDEWMPNTWKNLFLKPGLLGLASWWPDCPSWSALCTSGREPCVIVCRIVKSGRTKRTEQKKIDRGKKTKKKIILRERKRKKRGKWIVNV